MNTKHPLSSQAAILVLLLGTAATATAQDWPQWRGPNRDAHASGFQAPKTWPAQLTKKWQTTVGRGDASPALVGSRLYAFTRDEQGEKVVSLDAASGQVLWQDRYDALPASEPMGQHPGPRSSPAVADGKLVTVGVRGIVSCLDATAGKVLWRKDDFAGTWPRFFTASSPLIADGLCLIQLGGEEKGGVIAYDLATGDSKWKWTDDGTAYASPALLSVGGTRLMVTLTAKKVVGLRLADGKTAFEAPFMAQGRAYNAATPIVDGQTVIYAGSGRGTRAMRIDRQGEAYTPTELWSNPDNAVQFNTPVLASGRLYGLSQEGVAFCLNSRDGKTLWSSPLGGRGFGSIIEAGSALLALTPQGDLTVFEPSEKEFKKLATYKVAAADTYAYPIAARQGIYIKDKDSLTHWSLE